MGQYMVNGQVIDVMGDRPTAAQVKQEVGADPSDWVMANLPSGEVVKLNDHEALPGDRVSVVPAFTYGK